MTKKYSHISTFLLYTDFRRCKNMKTDLVKVIHSLS